MVKSSNIKDSILIRKIAIVAANDVNESKLDESKECSKGKNFCQT